MTEKEIAEIIYTHCYAIAPDDRQVGGVGGVTQAVKVVFSRLPKQAETTAERLDREAKISEAFLTPQLGPRRRVDPLPGL